MAFLSAWGQQYTQFHRATAFCFITDPQSMKAGPSHAAGRPLIGFCMSYNDATWHTRMIADALEVCVVFLHHTWAAPLWQLFNIILSMTMKASKSTHSEARPSKCKHLGQAICPCRKTKPNDRPSCGLPRFVQRSQAMLKKVSKQNDFFIAELSKPSITTVSLQYPPVPLLPQRCQEKKWHSSMTLQPLELLVNLSGVWLACITEASKIHHKRFAVRYWRTRCSTDTSG
mmetsp:Transcript_118320/g.235682  ORF Transcript_118320/g.235682 Transcript_118320/m.235682 type:complete len:229 (+) Transcript_118320:1869-2555(+)